MLAWFSDLNQRERRTMTACFGGWALDALDVMIFSFVIPSLLVLWHISKAEAGILATVTLVVSAFGGWFAGALADRFGRVIILQVAILWYAFFTFLCGFANDFNTLLVFRALQGLGFGGEWAAGAVLIGEVIRDKYRGRAVGIVQTGWSVGWGAAALLYTFFFAILPEEIAWRVMFWIGLAPALLVFWIRRYVEEPNPELRRAVAVNIGVSHLFAAMKRPYLSVTLLPTWFGMAGNWYLAGAGIAGAWFAWSTLKIMADRTLLRARNVLMASVLYLPVLYGLLLLDRA